MIWVFLKRSVFFFWIYKIKRRKRKLRRVLSSPSRVWKKVPRRDKTLVVRYRKEGERRHSIHFHVPFPDTRCIRCFQGLFKVSEHRISPRTFSAKIIEFNSRLSFTRYPYLPIKLCEKTFPRVIIFLDLYRANLSFIFFFSGTKTKLERALKFLFEDKACFRAANLDYSWSNLMVSKVLYLHYLQKTVRNENRVETRWNSGEMLFRVFLIKIRLFVV